MSASAFDKKIKTPALNVKAGGRSKGH